MTDASVTGPDRLRRIRDRHFDCYADLAAAAEEGRGEGEDWFAIVESEIANTRSALEWGLATARPETAAFAASLLWYWRQSRRFAEGRHLLDRALLNPHPPQTARTDALYAAGALAWDQADRPEALEHFEASRRLAASLGDGGREARAALMVGWASYHASLADQATEAFTAAADLSESPGERADALRGLGWTKELQGDRDAALQLHLDARAILEEAADPDLTAHYVVEVNFLLYLGRPDEALALAEKSMALARAGAGDLIFALIARERAAEALGDAEVLRRVVEEGIEITQAAGQLSVDHPRGHIRIAAMWEGRFQGRVAEHAMGKGDLETARNALDRALQVLDGVREFGPSDVGLRADLLERRARLAEDDGDLQLAEELRGLAAEVNRRLGHSTSPGGMTPRL